MDKELEKRIKYFMEKEITIRTSDYKGKGRPRKSDYKTMKRKELPDWDAFEIFRNGFKTTLY